MLALDFLMIPFAAALLLTAIHTYLGLHVLARKIVFVDLALAQIAALGATLAFMLGHAPLSLASYTWSLAFTLAGALLLTLSRHWVSARVTQETIVGVVYVVSAAMVIVLVDQAPQGAEHLKQLLTGSILTIDAGQLRNLFGLYALIALIHWFARKPMLALSFGARSDAPQRVFGWDFLFYALFGVVVTSSVAVAGVLLVFSFLIIPAMIGMLYSGRIAPALVIGLASGAFASAAGLAASYFGDLPTGATMVCAFGLVLVLAALLKPLLARTSSPATRLARGGRLAARVSLLVLLVSALWLSINPRADQPLFDAIEAAVPAMRMAFLTPGERDIWQSSRRSEISAEQNARQLTEKERASRWQGEAIPDDEVRRMSSYTQSYLEMKKGERFVQRRLRDEARERQRWVLGIPLILLSVAGLIALRKPNEAGRASA